MQTNAMRALGLLVDGTSGALPDSRQLRTGLAPIPASTALTPALRNHGITVLDTSTPLAGSGKPLFDVNGLWAHLCFDQGVNPAIDSPGRRLRGPLRPSGGLSGRDADSSAASQACCAVYPRGIAASIRLV